jgi:hypothetical protein
MADTPLAIAYEQAEKSVDSQRARLDGLRTRATALLSVAALVTSFLGAEALKDEKLNAKGDLVADRTLGGWELAAIGCFLAVGLTCLYILWPRRKGWIFRMNANTILRAYVDASLTLETTQRKLAEAYERHYATNAPQLEHRFWAFQLGAVLVALETLFWMLDLIRSP